MSPVIDAHLHVWEKLALPLEGTTTIVGPHEDASIERAVEILDRNGVERAVLIQPLFRGEDNAYIADCTRKQPERFAAVCVVDPRIPGAADRLQYWARERGCRGLRLRPRVADEATIFGDPATFPLWQRAARLGVVMSTLASAEHLDAIGEIANRFPDVPIVIDHLAHPDLSPGIEAKSFQKLLDLARHPRIFVKISGYYYFSRENEPYRDSWDLVRSTYDQFGPGRLLWGSDFPHVQRRNGYLESLKLIYDHFSFLTDRDRDLILGGNAQRLYWPTQEAKFVIPEHDSASS